MKKVMIYAYTALNLGDDLFIKILCERYPQTKFYLVAPKIYRKVFWNLNNLKVIPRETFFRRSLNGVMKTIFGKQLFYERRLAQTLDGIVYIGGSLFIQQNNWQKQLKFTEALHVKNQPFYLIGANFGPFTDDDFYQAHGRVFKQYTDICFRDKISYHLFQHLDNVRLAPDIVFQLKPNLQLINKQSIVISVIKPSIRPDLADDDDIYYQAMQRLITYFIHEGYFITLIAFCTEEQDDKAIQNIIGGLSKNYHKYVNQYIYEGKISDALNIIAQAKFIVATRLHAMLLGWLYQKRVLPIVYNEKMIHILKDSKHPGPWLTFADLKDLSEREIQHLIEQVKVHDITHEIGNSAKQFSKLDQWLKV